MPEKKMPVIWFAQVDGQGPGQAYEHGDQHRQRPVAHQLADAPLPDEVGYGDQDRQQPGQEALGHEPHGAGHPQHRPGTEAFAWRAAVQGKPQRHQAQVHPQGELRVEVGIPGLPGYQAKTQVEQRAGKALARVIPHAPGEQVGQHHAQDCAQDRGDAHTEQVFTEHRLAEGDEPIAGGGLLEITHAHEVRRHPVAAHQHFLADLGVAGFVWRP